MERIDLVYELDSFSSEALTWYDMWKSTNQPKNVVANFDIGRAGHKTLPFLLCCLPRFGDRSNFATYHLCRKALVQHSTARKNVVTSHHGEESNEWIMHGERTPQRNKFEHKKFINQVMDKFSSQPRRLQFLFFNE